MNPMNAWLIIGLAVVALWILWAVLNLIANLIDYWQHHGTYEVHAAPRGEDLSANKERERS